MLIPGLFFLLMFATVLALLWSGFELFRDQQDPLADRLEELQTHAIARASFAARRRGGGFLNNFLYLVSLVPGGEGWLRDTERELAQAGVRPRRALALYSLFQVTILALLVGAMMYLQRNSDLAPKFGGLVSALLLGWLLPQQVLHRDRKSTRLNSSHNQRSRMPSSA